MTDDQQSTPSYLYGVSGIVAWPCILVMYLAGLAVFLLLLALALVLAPIVGACFLVYAAFDLAIARWKRRKMAADLRQRMGLEVKQQ